LFSQETEIKDYLINPRIKSDKAFFGIEQLKKNLNGFFYFGITHLNYNSNNALSHLSIRHTAGISYNPDYNIAGLRLNSGISIFGICTRINIAYHTNFKGQSIILKPAVGIDLRDVTLTWGPNIILMHGLDKYFQKSNLCFELTGYL
jgi:hypothetical protein